MKVKEIKNLLSDRIPEIKKVCEKHGAPFRAVNFCGSLSIKDRKKGYRGRVIVCLNDREPGWRQKDNPDGRKALKTEIRKIVEGFRVRIAANYSCLVSQGGLVSRIDNNGKTIGLYHCEGGEA
mgnify:CR=1 FL=1